MAIPRIRPGFRSNDRSAWIVRIVGATFVLSGVVNLFGLGEDFARVFRAMAAANAGTRIEPLSGWIAAHAGPVRVLVAALMIVTGVPEMFRLAGWRGAALFQLVMMLGFVTLLQRGFPEVVFADGLCAIALAVALVQPPRVTEHTS